MAVEAFGLSLFAVSVLNGGVAVLFSITQRDKARGFSPQRRRIVLNRAGTSRTGFLELRGATRTGIVRSVEFARDRRPSPPDTERHDQLHGASPLLPLRLLRPLPRAPLLRTAKSQGPSRQPCRRLGSAGPQLFCTWGSGCDSGHVVRICSLANAVSMLPSLYRRGRLMKR